MAMEPKPIVSPNMSQEALMLERWQALIARIDQATEAARRPQGSVRLLAVSKTFNAEAVALVHRLGQPAFGENYIQEGAQKIAELRDYRANIEWHCIGPVQSNKTRQVAQLFDWVQSVDRQKVAQRLNDQRPEDLPPLNVCIQVNADGGVNKSGIAVEQAHGLALQVLAMPRLRLRGLMCIPDPVEGFAQQCNRFERARAIFCHWQTLADTVDTLSMGMSGDLEAAVASGSTMVRVGSALFGSRNTA